MTISHIHVGKPPQAQIVVSCRFQQIAGQAVMINYLIVDVPSKQIHLGNFSGPKRSQHGDKRPLSDARSSSQKNVKYISESRRDHAAYNDEAHGRMDREAPQRMPPSRTTVREVPPHGRRRYAASRGAEWHCPRRARRSPATVAHPYQRERRTLYAQT